MGRFRQKFIWLSLGIVIIAAAVIAIGGIDWGEPSIDVAIAAPGEVIVEMRRMRFVPEEIRIAPGTTVVFVNADPMEHNVVQTTVAGLAAREPEGFRSPSLRPRETFRYTFTEEGIFPILCDIGGHHLAGMVGNVIVTADVEQQAEHADSHV